MTDLHWLTLRDRAIQAFAGELPNAHTEQDLIDAFQVNPLAVSRSLDDVAGQYAAGKARSGWAVWRSRALAVHSSSSVAADVGSDRDARIAKAEAWVRNAGVHYDREAEVEDELFGCLGMLRDYASDELLRERLLRLWRERRPAGERCERDVVDRAESWRRTRKAVMNVKSAPARLSTLELVSSDADQDIPLPAVEERA